MHVLLHLNLICLIILKLIQASKQAYLIDNSFLKPIKFWGFISGDVIPWGKLMGYFHETARQNEL